MSAPSPNGTVGRNASGRFGKGNPGGPGNPHARRSAEIRAALMEAVSDEDVAAMIRTLVEKGKAGDVMAAREVLDRLLGKAKVTMEVDAKPERHPDEIMADLGAMLNACPDLARELAGMLPATV